MDWIFFFIFLSSVGDLSIVAICCLAPQTGSIWRCGDNSGLDGCKYLIVLENGKRLEPLIVEDKNFKFRDGQKIRLTYEQEREMMSICMAGQGVRVTCIEEVK